MRYAATIAGLRPKRGLNSGIGRIGGGCYRTHSGLTMGENTMALVELGFNKRNGCNKMVQDVLPIDIVDFDLFVGEGLSGR
jgi:hypothetical protein